MRLNLDADQLLSTTRAVRKRLDLNKPVERDVINECLELAIQAPTGSNTQNWHWVFVDDSDKKRALADLYGRAFDPYASSPGREYQEDDPRASAQPRVRDSATYLREHFHEVPVMMIPCAWGRPPEENAPVALQAGYWGSVLPAVWSFMLAARERGLGTAWTTLHLFFEKEAADIIGIPFDKVAQAGLMPIAYTKGTDFKPATRVPASDLTHWNTW